MEKVSKEALIKEFNEKGIEYEFLTDNIGYVKVKNYRVEFMIAESANAYMSQFGSSKTPKNFVMMLIHHINKQYKNDLQKFWDKLNIKINAIQGRVKVPGIGIIKHKGKKIINVEFIENYANLTNFLQKYMEVLKEEGNVESK
jgi:hypothetical protein